MYVKFIVFFIVTHLLVALSRDVSESERASRAAFIQKLLNKQKHLEGRIKLLGGSNKFEGNVYIYHSGRWGTVCDDSWDDAAAQVVCRIFNRTGVPTHGAQFGEALERYWMDDVVCEGDEKSLSQCIFTGWGSSDCDVNEVAGVICNENTEGATVVTDSSKPHLHEALDIRTASLRLVGGRTSNEGRIEIYHNGVWGSICPI